MSRPTEPAPAAAPSPFIHTIRVGWADCDPAAIAFTGRIAWFALDAIDNWWQRQLGHGWYQMELDTGIGTPFVHMSIDFRAPVTPRHLLQCEVQPLRIGNRSIRFRVTGFQDANRCFTGEFVCVFTRAKTHTSIVAPQHIRDVVEPLIRAVE